MAMNVFKSSWLPEFGYSFIVVALIDVNESQRVGDVLSFTFCPDGRVEHTYRAVSAKIQKSVISDEVIMDEMAGLAQIRLQNDVFELRRKVGSDRLPREFNLSFCLSTIENLKVSLIRQKPKPHSINYTYLTGDLQAQMMNYSAEIPWSLTEVKD